MTVQELIDLLKTQDPDATVYLLTRRHDLNADLQLPCETCFSNSNDVVTYPNREGVFIFEEDPILYF